MKLRKVKLLRFMQFIDAELDIDPNVTVIVGRNDTGKTSVLRWFFDQHVKEGAIHGRARPLIEAYRGEPIAFELEWSDRSITSRATPPALVLLVLKVAGPRCELRY